MIKDIMKPIFNELYEFMYNQGEKRYGLECKHEKVNNSICVNCKRKVVDRY